MDNEECKGYFYKRVDNTDLILIHCIIAKNNSEMEEKIQENKQNNFNYAKTLDDIDLKNFPDIKNPKIQIISVFKDDRNIMSKEEGSEIIIDIANILSSRVESINVRYDNRYYLENGMKNIKERIGTIQYPDKLTFSVLDESQIEPPSILFIKEIDEIIDMEVEKIQQYNFSPFEKIVAALAIAEKLIVTIPNVEINDVKDAGGNIYEALSRGNILCQGYTNIFNLFLNKLGINLSEIGVYGLTKKGNKLAHSVSYGSVDDPKYGIWGYYLFDVTPLGTLYSIGMENPSTRDKASKFILHGEDFKTCPFIGIGLDNWKEYEAFYGKINKPDDRALYELRISPVSIPYEKFEKAAEYVKSRFVFEKTENSSGNTSKIEEDLER